MDPVSGAASILAIVSLALQLQQSAHKVQRFFDAISDASSEILRLKGLVSIVHAIAVNIKTLFEEKLHGEDDVIGGEGIYDAMKLCQASLKPD